MDTPEEAGKGYFALPRQLRIDLRKAGINVIKLVWFLADVTFGWDASRWAALSYDEILNGRKKWSGERMEPGSGISNDSEVRRAVKDALEAGYIEALYEHGQTYYAIHHRYWAKGGLIPKWIIFKRVTWSQERDPIVDDSPAAMTSIAQPLEDDETAMTSIAGDYDEHSSQLLPSEQAVMTSIAEKSPETRPQQARREGKDTSLDTSNPDTSDRYVAASATPSPPSISSSKRTEYEDEPTSADVATPEAVPPLQASATLEGEERSPAKEELAARAVELEQQARDKEETRERQREQIKPVGYRSEIARLEANLVVAHPAANGRDVIEQKIALLQAMCRCLEQEQEAEYKSEVWQALYDEEMRLHAQYKALSARPKFFEEG